MVGLFDPVGAVAAGGKQASEPVVVEVAEAAGDSAGGFNDAIDRLGGPVGGSADSGGDCNT
jgi:hypothetical protein